MSEQKVKLYSITILPEETISFSMKGKLDISSTLLPTRHYFMEESIGLGIIKQDQEACNDKMEGNHTYQYSPSDNVSEVDPVKRLTTSSSQAVGEVEIEIVSFESNGRQKEESKPNFVYLIRLLKVLMFILKHTQIHPIKFHAFELL